MTANHISPRYPAHTSPNWYDASVHCEYHTKVASHSTDNCIALKLKIHHLIKYVWLKFGKLDQPLNVNANPLPNHRGGGNKSVSMIDAKKSKSITNTYDIKTPIE